MCQHCSPHVPDSLPPDCLVVVLRVPEIPRDGPKLHTTGHYDQYRSDKWHHVDPHSLCAVQKPHPEEDVQAVPWKPYAPAGEGHRRRQLAGLQHRLCSWPTAAIADLGLSRLGSCPQHTRDLTRQLPSSWQVSMSIFSLPRRLRTLCKPQILGLTRQVHKAAHQAVAVALAGVHVHVELA